MVTKLAYTAFAALGILASASSGAAAQTIKTLILQEDSDVASIRRDTRIQRNVLNAFNQALHAPSAVELQQRYGVEGLDVYDETALSLNWYRQGRVRRSDAELISLAQTVRNPRLDVMVLYTLHARAVPAAYMPTTNLHIALSYRALDVRSGRSLGGDNIDLDTDGIPMSGCAGGIGGQGPVSHCVNEFVAAHAERLVRDAAAQLAVQLAALSGRAPKVGRPPFKGSKGDYGQLGRELPRKAQGCSGIPTTFRVTFRGLPGRHVNQIVEGMTEWHCQLDVGLERSSPSEVSYSYKVRANEARLKRNFEISLDLMGVSGNVETRGINELVVKALPIRHD